MRSLVAHCHFGFGELYIRTDQRDKAHQELSAAIDLYHAMGMTSGIHEAEAALAKISAMTAVNKPAELTHCS